MIILSEADDGGDYNYIYCPKCNAHICDCSKNEKITVLKIKGHINKNHRANDFIIRCPKCKIRYFISITNN